MDTGLRTATVTTPIGEMLLVASEKGLVQVHLPESKGVPWSTDERYDAGAHCLPEARAQLHAYAVGELREFDLPLDERGSDFQLRVWAALRRIPYGETCSYGDIATAVGEDPRVASRAVGLANGSNPIPIVIPCHRVIGANGTLTGYAGGIERKQTLLELEQDALF